MKQIKFYDKEDELSHGGILLDNGDVICGCCGGLFKKDEEGTAWKLEKIYDFWVDLTAEICGDDLQRQLLSRNGERYERYANGTLYSTEVSGRYKRESGSTGSF